MARRKHVVGQFGALNHLNTAQILPMEFIVVRGRDDQHVWIHHAGQWRNIEVRKASFLFLLRQHRAFLGGSSDTNCRARLISPPLQLPTTATSRSLFAAWTVREAGPNAADTDELLTTSAGAVWENQAPLANVFAMRGWKQVPNGGLVSSLSFMSNPFLFTATDS